MNDIVLTVIIPVYASEDTLPRAIRSVLTCCTNLEVLVIDDASPGNCQKAVAGFQNIRIIRHEVNKGLAEARKTGVQEAKGRYVVHLDADDWIVNAIYDRIIEKLENSSYKIGMFGLQETGSSSSENSDFKHVLPLTYGACGDELLENIAMNSSGFVWHVAVNKVMETAWARMVYQTYSTMPKVNMFEDFLFSCLLFYQSRQKHLFYLDDTVGYLYYRSETSMTLDENAEKAKRNLDDVNAVFSYLEQVFSNLPAILSAFTIRQNNIQSHWSRNAHEDIPRQYDLENEKAFRDIVLMACNRLQLLMHSKSYSEAIIFGGGTMARDFSDMLMSNSITIVEHCKSDEHLEKVVNTLSRQVPVIIGSLGSADIVAKRFLKKWPDLLIITALVLPNSVF